MTVKWRHMAIVSVLVLAACGKENRISSPDVPLTFNVTTAEIQTKAVTGKTMSPKYDTNESFVVYSAFSEEEFDPSGTYVPFWDEDDGVTCSYNIDYRAWLPAGDYLWPMAGYLTFQAYSPASAGSLTSHDWSTGFTFTAFTVPDTDHIDDMYDLLYTDRVENRQRSQYNSNNPYDERVGDGGPYKGIDLSFKHALCMIEVTAVNGLGSGAPSQFYIQKVELRNLWRTATFSNGSWGSYSGAKADYTLLNLAGNPSPADWQQLPGGEQEVSPLHPDKVMMLLPQPLDRSVEPGLNTTNDAYIHIEWKKTTGAQTVDDVSLQVTDFALGSVWEPGIKYCYKLIFSDYIEFEASIRRWDDEITGTYLIN